MERNLDHRIEVVMPAESPHVRAEMEAVFKSLLSDNVQAWELGPDGSWARVQPKKSERRRPAQTVAMRRRLRARRPAPAG
jgi:polyphosphate kinase